MSNPEPPASPSSTVELWRVLLRKKKVPLTPPRLVLLEVMSEQSEPFDAEELLREAKKKDNLIAAATVYRNLGLFEELGICRRLPVRDKKESYLPVRADEANLGRGHVRCLDCHQLFPLNDPCFPFREGPILKDLGFSSKDLQFVVEAHCENEAEGSCQKKKKKP